MQTCIISRYNHDTSWMKDYDFNYVVFDRSKVPMEGSIVVPNRGTDLFDKLTYIIDNYENLPATALFLKCNIFKYISKEEFDKVCKNRTFTPLHTQHHKTEMPVSYYREDGMYCEINNYWYLNGVPVENVKEYMDLIGNKFREQKYKPFSPGSNYILTKENILKYPKDFYQKLRDIIGYERYPGEAFLLERDLYNIFS